MNRPTLPYAISSVTADRLPSANHDKAGLSAMIEGLLATYDQANDVRLQLLTTPAFRPVAARSHVNRAKLSLAKLNLAKLNGARALISASA